MKNDLGVSTRLRCFRALARRPASAADACFLRFGSLASSPILRAQQPAPAAPAGTPDPAAIYKSGVEAFDSGHYEQAISQLNEVIKTVGTADPALEPAYFDVAAAYYNLQRYDESLTAFKDYRTKYPKGTRLAGRRFFHRQLPPWQEGLQWRADRTKTLEGIPSRREQVLFLEGNILSEQKKTAEAIMPLEALTVNGLHSSLARARRTAADLALRADQASFPRRRR